MRLAPCTPVLARPDGRTQIGVAAPLLLTGLTESQRHLVAAAETAAMGPESLAELGRLGEQLVDAEALVADHPRDDRLVAIHTGGRVGLELGAALAAAGVTVGFVDTRPASDEPGLYPRRALVATCAGGAGWAVRERHPSARVTDASDPAVAVQISLGGAARHVTAGWEHDGLPHLLVAVDERGATVGPLVVPGETACGRCLALERSDEDPAWALLLDQLSGRQARPPAALVPGIVAAAVRMILAHLDGAQASDEAWRIDLGGPAVAAPAKAHRDCGCGAWVGADAPALRLLPDLPSTPPERREVGLR